MLEIFQQRNPTFSGNISVMGHFLGSCILFDLLYHQVQQYAKEFSGCRSQGAVSRKVKNLMWRCSVCCRKSQRNTHQQDRRPLVKAIIRNFLKSFSGLYMDQERSDAFKKRLKALTKLLLIDNILIYICTTGHFQRTFHLQVTINFVYEILIDVTTPSRMLINYLAMLPSNIIAGPKLAQHLLITQKLQRGSALQCLSFRIACTCVCLRVTVICDY